MPLKGVLAVWLAPWRDACIQWVMMCLGAYAASIIAVQAGKALANGYRAPIACMHQWIFTLSGGSCVWCLQTLSVCWTDHPFYTE